MSSSSFVYLSNKTTEVPVDLNHDIFCNSNEPFCMLKPIQGISLYLKTSPRNKAKIIKNFMHLSTFQARGYHYIIVINASSSLCVLLADSDLIHSS